MVETDAINWKGFVIRLIEALRWPIALAVIVWILRDDIGVVIHTITGTPHS